MTFDVRQITVGAAANLTGVMDELARAFEKRTKIHVVISYGSTAQLSQQIENGAPFDVFAAADTEHVDDLVKKGKLTSESRQLYALGQLALWIPKGEQLGVAEMKDLAKPGVRFVAVAQPDLAPYGAAAVDALRASKLWGKVQPKIVYAANINQARQQAAMGNADAAFAAYSLVMKGPGRVILVPMELYKPLDQAMGTLTSTRHPTESRLFTAFVVGGEGQEILLKSGYLKP